MGYGIGLMRKIQRPHPSIKREGMRRPKSFEWICHPSDYITYPPIWDIAEAKDLVEAVRR
jgi:hypothetical protein